MPLDHKRLRDNALKKLGDDEDDIFADANKPAPNPNSVQLKGMVHYIVKAVIEEIDDNAKVDAGIEVEDSQGTVIGTTREGSSGTIS